MKENIPGVIDARELQNERGEMDSVKNQKLLDEAEKARRQLAPLTVAELELVANKFEISDSERADIVAESLANPLTSLRHQVLAGIISPEAAAAYATTKLMSVGTGIDGNYIERSEFKLTGDDDFDDALFKCIDILAVKGEDYTIGTGDRLHNFKTVAEFTGLTPEQVLGVYFYKHVSAIFSYIKKGGKSESEPIEGRISDCINYLLLFQKMVNTRKRGELK